MLTLIVVTLVSLSVGVAVRVADRGHQPSNPLLLPGVAVISGLVSWVVLQFAGLGYHPRLFWLSWALPLLIATAVTLGAAWWLGRHRERAEAEALERLGDL